MLGLSPAGSAQVYLGKAKISAGQEEKASSWASKDLDWILGSKKGGQAWEEDGGTIIYGVFSGCGTSFSAAGLDLILKVLITIIII